MLPQRTTRRGFLGMAIGGAAAAGACQVQVRVGEDPVAGGKAGRFADLARRAETAGFRRPNPISPGEFTNRRDALRDAIAPNAALLLTPGANLQWATGVKWRLSERLFGLLLPHQGEAVWLCPGFEERKARETIGDLGADGLEVWQEDEDPFALLERVAGGQGLAVDPACPFGWAARMGADTSSAFALLRSGRWVKSKDELALQRHANIATKAAYAAAAAELAEGMTESDLVRLCEEAHAALGLDCDVFVLFGPNAAFPHGTDSPRHLERGDLVLMDGGTASGYLSDITRTIVFDAAPTDRQREVWNAVRDAQTAALDLVRPGAVCGDLDGAARAVIDKSGFGPDYRLFMHRLGHGIGLEIHEEPYLVRGNQVALEPGMTFSDEPGIYVYGELGVRLEDIVAVTSSGAEVFGPRSLSLDDPFAGHLEAVGA